jgi:hypothetical protein
MVIYRSAQTVNLYELIDRDRLATQMAGGRYLQILEMQAHGAWVQLLEDGYTGWVRQKDIANLEPVSAYTPPPPLDRGQIEGLLPQILNYIYHAQAQPHEYLWGGTVPPHFDCSGLMQAAFASVGVWLPRDAYQQEAFSQPLSLDQAEMGDLIFFGSPAKATHVGFYLGAGSYIHSSGKDHGHNGIQTSSLEGVDRVSQTYAQQWRGVGRVMASYSPPLLK